MTLRRHWLDAGAVLLLVLVSGNPAFTYLIGKEASLVAVPLVLALASFFLGTRFRKTDPWIPALFAFIATVHLFEFGPQVVPATLGFLLKIVTALLAIRLVRDFSATYATVLYWLASISLVLYIPQLILTAPLREYAQAIAVPYSPGTLHVGIHNFNPINHALRNSGFFWEPGAFAGYIVLALILSFARALRDRSPLRLTGRHWMLIVALLTTQSTTGYAALALIAIVFIFLKFGFRFNGRMLFIAIALAFSAHIAYQKLPFLEDKILHQFTSTRIGAERSELTRFGNALYDWEFIRARPIFGWSPYTGTRRVVDSEVEEWLTGQGNGLSSSVVRFGIAGIVVFILAVYRSIRAGSRHPIFSLAATFTVLLLMVGEQFLNFPLFLTLLFAPRVQTGPRSERAAHLDSSDFIPKQELDANLGK